MDAYVVSASILQKEQMISSAAAINPFAYQSMSSGNTITINAPTGWKYAIMEVYIAGWMPYSPVQTIEPGKTDIPIGSTAGSSTSTYYRYTTTTESIVFKYIGSGNNMSIAGCIYWYI